MDRKIQVKIVSEILLIGKDSTADIDVWRPTGAEIKTILAKGHVLVRPNSEHDDCTIFTLRFEKLDNSIESHAISVNLFCNEPEAKFMRKYLKREEVNK